MRAIAIAIVNFYWIIIIFHFLFPHLQSGYEIEMIILRWDLNFLFDCFTLVAKLAQSNINLESNFLYNIIMCLLLFVKLSFYLIWLVLAVDQV